jgi:DNA-binding FadR family transcriptional regulator
VAEQIRRHIGLGLIDAGEALPPERELTRIFGVGRGTIQAALRMLEADHLLESRRGASGGTFVLAPLEDEAGRQRSLLELKLSRDQVADALAFRRVVELGAVKLAAEHPAPDGIAALRTNLQRWDEAETEREFHRLDTEFHISIGVASGSEHLRKAIEQTRLELNDAILAQPDSDRWRDRILREHESILAAIEAGKAPAAVRTMGRHLEHTEKGVDVLITALA